MISPSSLVWGKSLTFCTCTSSCENSHRFWRKNPCPVGVSREPPLLPDSEEGRLFSQANTCCASSCAHADDAKGRSRSRWCAMVSTKGPTLFNIHVADICKVCRNDKRIFYFSASDAVNFMTSLLTINRGLNGRYLTVLDLTNIANWWRQNGLISNHKKCEVMLIRSRHTTTTSRDLEISLDGNLLKQTNSVKYLGVNIDHNLSWNTHVHAISRRVYPRLKLLNRISRYLTRSVLLRIYKQTILPLMDYGCIVWGDCGKQNAKFPRHASSARATY